MRQHVCGSPEPTGSGRGPSATCWNASAPPQRRSTRCRATAGAACGRRPRRRWRARWKRWRRSAAASSSSARRATRRCWTRWPTRRRCSPCSATRTCSSRARSPWSARATPPPPAAASPGDLAEELAARGLVVVSGLARGIDAAAHQGALRKGRTVAVVAGGLDQPYPPENASLQARIAAEGGAVLAEAPLGTAPLARHFPRRNRIVAGLVPRRGAGGGGAALGQPHHRPPRPGSGAGDLRRARQPARRALPRLQRPDPPGRAPDRKRRRTCWPTCRRRPSPNRLFRFQPEPEIHAGDCESGTDSRRA